MKRIDEREFREVKKYLRWHGVKRTAMAYDLHESTIYSIKGAKDFADYRRGVKAEHPPVMDSLADRVLELHRMTFQEPGVTYFKPLTARRAVIELQIRQVKLNKEPEC